MAKHGLNKINNVHNNTKKKFFRVGDIIEKFKYSKKTNTDDWWRTQLRCYAGQLKRYQILKIISPRKVLIAKVKKHSIGNLGSAVVKKVTSRNKQACIFFNKQEKLLVSDVVSNQFDTSLEWVKHFYIQLHKGSANHTISLWHDLCKTGLILAQPIKPVDQVGYN